MRALLISFTFFWLSCTAQNKPDQVQDKNPYFSFTDTTHLNVSDQEWKKILPAELYNVARENGTERAFTGKYWDKNPIGTYHCAVCGNILFRSDSIQKVLYEFCFVGVYSGLSDCKVIFRYSFCQLNFTFNFKK